MHNPEVIAAVLEPAGWTDLRTEVRHLDLPFGGLDPETAAATALDFGPTRIVTADIDDQTRRDVSEALADVLTKHVDAQGHVVLGGTFLITTATREPQLRATSQ